MDYERVDAPFTVGSGWEEGGLLFQQADKKSKAFSVKIADDVFHVKIVFIRHQ